MPGIHLFGLFSCDSQEMHLLIKSFLKHFECCMWRRKLFKWPHNSAMEMWTEAAYQCGIFTCLFIPTLGCFYPVGQLIAYHYLDESTQTHHKTTSNSECIDPGRYEHSPRAAI